MDHQQLFNRLYESHYDPVFRLCKGYFNGQEALAADATQEVFLKVWQHLPAFRGDARVSTWLYRIAVNTCLSYLRKPSAKKEIKTEQLPDLAAEGYDPVVEERLKKMYGCIQQLDETGKMIILMVLEGLEYTAIAEVAGIREDTLRVRIHRIKKQLSICVQS
ncbi:MAG TPA: RNA polymerase sigma factor [Lacibacter sp.]|nr:RNA polymerase sigma factor [Lacibacter sp.]HMO90127.1 RNA polymerase sigma factor [Lacibacter sp.]HMP85854.1 RNA polymerase sigma factor [Lacibacter sp.]